MDAPLIVVVSAMFVVNHINTGTQVAAMSGYFKYGTYGL
jgi:hypothetical protein